MKTCKFIKVQTRLLAALSLVLITIVSCGIWPPTPEKCKERWSVERIERITKINFNYSRESSNFTFSFIIKNELLITQRYEYQQNPRLRVHHQ